MEKSPPRRSFLSCVGGAISVSLAGCSAAPVSPNDEPTAGSPTRRDPTPTPSPTEPEPTTTVTPEPTPIPTPETRLALDEWHEREDVRYTVTSIECLTEFEDEGTGNSRSMPEDELLVVVETRLHNTGERFQYADAPFVVAADGRAYGDVPRVGSSRIDELARVEHMARFNAEGRRIEHDETVRSWVVAILPRSHSCEDVSVVFEARDDGEPAYPVAWTRS